MTDIYDANSQGDGTESSKTMQRRRRPPLSCTECRRRKLKCDRSLPCGQCVRSKTTDSCMFSGSQPREQPESPRRLSPTGQHARASNDRPVSNGGRFVFDSKMGPKSSSDRVSKRSQPDEMHELKHRLRVLESALGKPNALHTPDHSMSEVFSDNGTSCTEAAGVDERVKFLPDACFRGKKGKTRYFGRSHATTTMSFVSSHGAVEDERSPSKLLTGVNLVPGYWMLHAPRSGKG